MNLKQKKFIEEKLIPFILRERGQGFMMDQTILSLTPGENFSADGLTHTMPICGSAGCVLGSVRLLRKKVSDYVDAAKVLGISPEAAYGLFYTWYRSSERYCWPPKDATAFAEAKTPLTKAKVAARLLKKVVKTNGLCLDSEAGK